MKLLIAILLAGFAEAQSFEVASIKLHPGPISMIGPNIADTTVTMTAMNLRDLVSYAYEVRVFQVDGGPKWIDDRYDIQARVSGEAAPSKDRVRAMLRSLLAERFKLSVQQGTKKTPVYALTIAKGGHRLKEYKGDDDTLILLRGEVATFKPASVESFATSFPLRLDRPVVDKTGLTGRFEFELRLKSTPEGTTGPSGESIFTAVEEQLGLKMEAQDAMVPVITIASVDRPSEN
jgi:uncharacterized protein (TIGR03435 family)